MYMYKTFDTNITLWILLSFFVLEYYPLLQSSFIYQLNSSFNYRGGKLLDFSIECKYVWLYLFIFDKGVDDVLLRNKRDKYLCRVCDTFVYLAPCLTSRSSFSCSSLVFYCLINTMYIYTHTISKRHCPSIYSYKNGNIDL
jgi:hypothetical protein